MDYEEYLKQIHEDERHNTPFIEILLPPGQLDLFSMDDSIYSFLKESTVDSRIEFLKERLLRNLDEVNFTEHQRKVLDLYMKGYPQIKIAEILGNTQPAVHKALYGNIVYSNRDQKHHKKRYGGILNKIRKYFSKDEHAKKVLKEIERIKNADLIEEKESNKFKDLYFARASLNKRYSRFTSVKRRKSPK